MLKDLYFGKKYAIICKANSHCRGEEDDPVICCGSDVIYMKKQINIGSMYGVRDEDFVKGIIDEIPEKDFRDLVANGQNLLFLTIVHGSPIWEKCFARCLAMAEKYNIRVVVHDNVMNDLGMNITPGDVKKYTAGYANSPVYVGQGFHDEPSSATYPEIAKLISTYKSVYPDKMTFVNLLPMYAANFVFGDDDFETYLEDFAKIVDCEYICTDVYPLLIDGDTKYTYDDYLRSFDIQAQLCRKYNREFRMYIQSMEFLPNREPSLEEFRFQVYCALSFGARTILHFLYDVPGGAIRKDRTKKSVWSYSRTVNNELNAISDVYVQYKNVGAYTFKTEDAPVYADFDNEYQDFDTIQSLTANETILIGCFEKEEGAGTAFTLVNLSELQDYTVAEVEFELKDAGKVTLYQKGIPYELTPVDGKYYVVLDSGEGVFVTVE